ncbi:MAG: hypothetical protein DRI46_13170, partial [Chloroflexi bacterium]
DSEVDGIPQSLIDKRVGKEPAKTKTPKVEETPKVVKDMPKEVNTGLGSVKTSPIGGTLHRETNQEGVNDLLNNVFALTQEKGSLSPTFLTDSKDLALGQKGNTGVQIEFDGDYVSGTENVKPGTGIEGVTGKEFKSDYINNKAITSITFEEKPKLKHSARTFLNRHFDKSEDGLTYTRKPAVAPKKAVKKKAVRKRVQPVQDTGYTAKKLDQAIEDGKVSYDTAQKMAKSGVGISVEEGKIWLADNAEIEETIDIARQDQQLQGWEKSGKISDADVNYATANPEVLADAEKIKSEEGLSFSEAATEAVKRHKGVDAEVDSYTAIPTEEEVQFFKDTEKLQRGVQYLKHIRKTTKNPVYKSIMSKLIDHVPYNLTVEVVDAKHPVAKDIKEAKGLYDPRDESIYLKSPFMEGSSGVNENTVMHEVLHSVMNKLISQGKIDVNNGVDSVNARLYKDLEKVHKKLLEEVQAKADRGETLTSAETKMLHEKGGKKIREMITYAFTDKDMQELMNSIPYDSNRTLMGQVANIISKAIKWVKGGRVKANSSLMEIINIGDELLTEANQTGESIRDKPSYEIQPDTEMDAEIDPEAPVYTHKEQVEYDSKQQKMTAKAKVSLERTMTTGSKVLYGNASEDFLVETLEELGIASAGELDVLLQQQEGDALSYINNAVKNILERSVKLNSEEKAEVSRLTARATIEEDLLLDDPAYQSMSVEQKIVYRRWYDHNKEQGQLLLDATKKALLQQDLTPKQKADATQLTDTLEAKMKEGVYFPMQRHGDFRLGVKLKGGQKYVSRSNSRTEMEAEIKKLKEKGATVEEIGFEGDSELEAQYVMDISSYEKAKALLESSLEGTDTKAAAAAKDAIWNLYMDMSSPSKLKERTSKRKFIAGASPDLDRNIAQSINYYHGITQLLYAPERAKGLQNVKREIDSMPLDTPKQRKDKLFAERLETELEERQQIKPRGEISKGLTKVSYVLNLAMNPSTGLINMTQPHIVGIPVLGADYGDVRAAASILKAQAEVLRRLSKQDAITG